MSRDDIMNMPVGRELDALVAEKVMNLCVLDTVQQYGDGCVVSDKGFDEWTRHPEYGRIGDPDLLEPYSTDISAAWEALNKFTPHQITQSKTGFSHSDLQYRAIIGKNHNSAYGDTAPEAICKAALLAVME